MPHLAYLSLGSNLGDREAQLRDALTRLSALGHIVAVSAIYETEPVDFTEQPWFMNCAVAFETAMTAQQFMSSILGIEQEMGRRRLQGKGPRSIDIDILLFDDAIIHASGLTIPHPAMHQRRFVLEPLAEISAEVLHPVSGKTIRELCDQLEPGQVVRKLEPDSRAQFERTILSEQPRTGPNIDDRGPKTEG